MYKIRFEHRLYIHFNGVVTSLAGLLGDGKKYLQFAGNEGGRVTHRLGFVFKDIPTSKSVARLITEFVIHLDSQINYQ